MAFGDADASTPAFKSANSGAVATTDAFTPPNSSIIVIADYHDTASGNTTNTSAVTDSIDGATGWTNVRVRNKADSGGQNARVALWWKKITSGASMTVTTTGTNCAGACGIWTRVITGIDLTTPIDVSEEGSNASGAISLAVTVATEGARAFLVASDWNVAANMTAGTDQTAIVATGVGTGPDTRVYAGVQNAVSSVGGVTMSTATPTTGNTNNYIAFALRPSSSGDANVTPSTVAAVASVPAPAVATGSTVTAVTVAAVAAVPAPSVATGSTVAPDVVAAVATIPAPAVATGSTIAPGTVPAVAAIPAATVATGSTVASDVVAAVATVPAPSITAGGDVNITPNTVAALVSVLAPSVSVGVTLAVATVAALSTVPSVVVTAVTTVAPATVVAMADVFEHGIVSVGSTVNATTVAAVASVPSPSVVTGMQGITGLAHGALPMALGSVTVHTDSIVGAVT